MSQYTRLYCDSRVGCWEFISQYTVVYCDRGAVYCDSVHCFRVTVWDIVHEHCLKDFSKKKMK